MTPGADPLVWLADAASVDAASLARHAAWLGASERERCARFLRAERRRQFIVGRALLRMALGSLLARDPAMIELDERPGQSPGFIFPPGMNGGFSISHSGRWVACAASTRTRLGLDIERIDPERDVLALSEQAFGAADVALLQAAGPAARIGTFYRMWCAHEAGIKLGQDKRSEYALEAPGLAGVLACAAPLAAAPHLVQVCLNDCRE